jgi:hypothetical protein
MNNSIKNGYWAISENGIDSFRKWNILEPDSGNPW